MSARPIRLAVLLLLAVGCEEGLTVEVVEGRDYDEVRLVAIHRGSSTKADVRELLGEPWRRGGRAAAEEWEYYARIRTTKPRFLLLCPTSPPSHSYKRLIITFKQDFVDAVERQGTALEEE